jgi:PST family polysaccharide transporter
MSDAALGLYGRAYQLASTPAALLGNVLDQVLFPTLAGRQHDKARLAENFRRAVCLTTAVTAPLAVVAVVLAPELVRIVLGPRWTGVVVAFQILAGTLTFRTAYKLSDAMAKATGRVYARAWRQGLYAALVVGGALACRPWGIEGVAAAVAGAIVVNYLVMSGLSLAVTELAWASFVAAHLRGLMLATVTALAVGASSAGLRAVDAPAVVVLAGATALAIVAILVPSALAPNRMLGPELMWLLHQMRSMTGGRNVER